MTIQRVRSARGFGVHLVVAVGCLASACVTASDASRLPVRADARTGIAVLKKASRGSAPKVPTSAGGFRLDLGARGTGTFPISPDVSGGGFGPEAFARALIELRSLAFGLEYARKQERHEFDVDISPSNEHFRGRFRSALATYTAIFAYRLKKLEPYIVLGASSRHETLSLISDDGKHTATGKPDPAAVMGVGINLPIAPHFLLNIDLRGTKFAYELSSSSAIFLDNFGGSNFSADYLALSAGVAISF